ncbi:SAM-dependent methyltransferase [Streptomyces sp. NPDC038707]|uniref:SAM-dependent methyltransferase n=1 Tax=Streptomyces sp. NPDC038707 TaxID=3154329 RepID=UPI0034050956
MAHLEVLDLYSCQGGATRGYKLAGFTSVTGVDKDPQPRYCGDEFHQHDAIAYVLENLDEIRRRYAFIHASPPCQFDSDCQRIMRNDHPDLIGPTREALELTGLPYVIENVGGAVPKLRDPVELCGTMFGLQTYRHRYFEAGGGFSFQAPEHPEHAARQVKMGRSPRPGEFIQAIGNFSGVGIVRDDWGVHWMNRDGIREAIPPAYTEYIGRQVISHLNQEQTA